MSLKSAITGALTIAALVAPASSLAAGPYAKGPDPSASTLLDARGSYAVTKTAVPDRDTPTFGSATLWAPVAPAGTTFGAVAISPGWTESESAIAWLGPRLAAQGFVVITFNPQNAFLDQPEARGIQLNAALDVLVANPATKALVDPARLAAVGHSMGGGGTLEAAKRNPAIDAIVGLEPWNRSSAWENTTAASLIVGAQNDWIAPTPFHAIPFFKAIPASVGKAYLELANADHFATNTPNDAAAVATISWLKRYVDDDTRYTAMLKPNLVGAPPAAVRTWDSTNVR